MPIYEYCCPKCDHQFEELILNKEKEVTCPACGAKEAKKLISRCRVQSGTNPALDNLNQSGSGGCSGCSGGSCSSCG